MTAWLGVVLLGLTGARGAAVVIAFISVTIAWLALSVQLLGPGPWRIGPGGLVQFLGPAGGIPIVLASLAACSLAFSPGPRRGLAIVGWWRACLMIAALSAGFGLPFIVQRVHPAALALTGDLAFRLLGILAILLAIAVTRGRSPVGRRVAGLVAAGLVPSFAVLLADIAPPGWTLLVDLLVAVLVWPVAIVSWLGRIGPAARGVTCGPCSLQRPAPRGCLCRLECGYTWRVPRSIACRGIRGMSSMSMRGALAGPGPGHTGTNAGAVRDSIAARADQMERLPDLREVRR